jgi:GT2 family glycosyltransferase
MVAWVVIPTVDARDLLAQALESLSAQTLPPQVVVVDNGSTDGTAEFVAERFPAVELVRLPRNVGFGRAVNHAARELPAGDDDALVLVNNDTVCEPRFVEELCAPLERPGVGMSAGVLLQAAAPERVDSAGIELDTTLRSYDYLWDEDVAALAGARDPVGPCGGAAGYRFGAFRQAGGFDEAFFAYWEDVDLALRLRLAGWSCALAPAARAVHHHGQTLGASSPAQRALDAFGRGYVLARYRAGKRRPLVRVKVALVDWPALAAHLFARREAAPLRERWRGRAAGRGRPALRPPFELATVPLRTALARQWTFLGRRLGGRAPRHFYETEGAAGRR